MKTCSVCAFWAPMDQEEEFPDIGFCTVSLPMIIETQSKLDNTTNAEDNAQDCDCFKHKEEVSLLTQDAPGEDFTLNSDRCWIKVKGFAINIHTTDEGVVVDIYKDGEGDEAIASCYAYDNEVEDEEEEGSCYPPTREEG